MTRRRSSLTPRSAGKSPAASISDLRDTETLLTLYNVDMLFVGGPDVGGWDPIPGLNAFTRPETITPPG
jgi:hypothetical protein